MDTDSKSDISTITHNITIKHNDESHTIKLNGSKITLELLINECTKLIPQLIKIQPFKLQYYDEENDFICMTSDNELITALQEQNNLTIHIITDKPSENDSKLNNYNDSPQHNNTNDEDDLISNSFVFVNADESSPNTNTSTPKSNNSPVEQVEKHSQSSSENNHYENKNNTNTDPITSTTIEQKPSDGSTPIDNHDSVEGATRNISAVESVANTVSSEINNINSVLNSPGLQQLAETVATTVSHIVTPVENDSSNNNKKSNEIITTACSLFNETKHPIALCPIQSFTTKFNEIKNKAANSNFVSKSKNTIESMQLSVAMQAVILGNKFKNMHNNANWSAKYSVIRSKFNNGVQHFRGTYNVANHYYNRFRNIQWDILQMRRAIVLLFIFILAFIICAAFYTHADHYKVKYYSKKSENWDLLGHNAQLRSSIKAKDKQLLEFQNKLNGYESDQYQQLLNFKSQELEKMRKDYLQLDNTNQLLKAEIKQLKYTINELQSETRSKSVEIQNINQLHDSQMYQLKSELNATKLELDGVKTRFNKYKYDTETSASSTNSIISNLKADLAALHSNNNNQAYDKRSKRIEELSNELLSIQKQNQKLIKSNEELSLINQDQKQTIKQLSDTLQIQSSYKPHHHHEQQSQPQTQTNKEQSERHKKCADEECDCDDDDFICDGSDVSSYFNKAYNKLQNTLNNIGDKLDKTLNKESRSIGEFFNSAANKLKTKQEKVQNHLKNKIPKIRKNFERAVQKAWNKLGLW